MRVTGPVALAVAPCWVVSHKLVRSGRIAVEDLNLRYQTVLRALATLLETQTPRVRDSTLRAYCERLHVRHSGSDRVRAAGGRTSNAWCTDTALTKM